MNLCRLTHKDPSSSSATGFLHDLQRWAPLLLNSVLPPVGKDIVSYIFLCFVNSKVAFTEDVGVNVEQFFR